MLTSGQPLAWVRRSSHHRFPPRAVAHGGYEIARNPQQFHSRRPSCLIKKRTKQLTNNQTEMNLDKIDKISDNLFNQAVDLIETAKRNIVKNINNNMVHTYFGIGKMIVEEEQNGELRAEYGTQLMKNLSIKLLTRYKTGYSQRNIEQMRQFYIAFTKAQTLSAELEEDNKSMKSIEFHLSWSHYLLLMRIQDINERKFYEIESNTNGWGVRELKRQFDSGLYQRLVLSKDKEGIKQLATEGQIIETTDDIIKEPYILEFTGFPEHAIYSENDLENALIIKLEHFLLELGKGFTYVARQKRFSFDERHFYIDLVFFNRLLRCFVLIDLKIGDLKHQDIGQMQMYVNYYDRYVKLPEENKTVGIILCRDKSETLVEITLPIDNDQIFASRYQTILPSKEELKQLIDNKNEK
jgi:predicted nuclease of restriction endonuclease-like (RecB) superfamily